ncbi:MAG: hypothetical protein AVDCRST_MAG15-584 [uncultured Rubellimicrobium sp.]|uniref:Uncharacterized protein n=1 Tax=uncultured Rubellimicrobium sp. TaxID=543078 RepID=A0A6J4NP31_9RHOB|nr:MAG: hypothetical protein AVDCRST_MAG15-584 [uncultured Rubellimicrobium sp.]
MPELDADLQELIAILRQARDAVRDELELRQADDPNNEALLRLLTSVRSFADQAMSLFMMMADIGSDEASTREVGDLAESFSATEDLIELALGLG